MAAGNTEADCGDRRPDEPGTAAVENLGDKKIRPIESPAAAIGYFPISKLAPMAMLRDYPPRSGMETEEAIANSRALPGLLGSVARFRTTIFHLRPSTHWSCDSPLGFPF